MWKGCLSYTNYTLRTQGVHISWWQFKWVSEWVFYIPLTARSYRDVDLGLKSHMKDWRSLGSNSWPLGYKASSITTTPLRHSFPIFHIVKYIWMGGLTPVQIKITLVQSSHAWSMIYNVCTLNMSRRRTKPTILQCTCDQQRLLSVCASTHYIKQASWIAQVHRRCILYDSEGSDQNVLLQSHFLSRFGQPGHQR